MIIGTFNHDKKTGCYKGDILTLGFQFSDVELSPAKKGSEREPDYRLTAKTASGHVELGAAWKRTSEAGNEYLSVSLDGPLMAASVFTALFPEKGGAWSLIWSRAKKADMALPEAKASAKKKAA